MYTQRDSINRLRKKGLGPLASGGHAEHWFADSRTYEEISSVEEYLGACSGERKGTWLTYFK
jgi:hypothetical protein